MCTVSYLPKGKGFIITSNRDEAPDRGIFNVDVKRISGVSVTFPRDPAAGGSWFAVADSGAAACLLNGAFEPYDRSIPYGKSRGIVILDWFSFDSARKFAGSDVFVDAAPFTLVTRGDRQFNEFVWDGQKLHWSELDPSKPHFWSSVTLYPPPVREWRRQLFDKWIKDHADFRQEDIIDFHRYGGHGDQHNDFVMNRNEQVKTLSITSAESKDDKVIFSHTNLNDPRNTVRKVVVKSHSVANGT